VIADAIRSLRALLGNKMTINTAIKNDQEYEAALEAIEQILEAAPGTPEGDKFDSLAKMIAEYDDIHHKLNE
jgi:HTH-type transcriptional regulator/antitoxin HigA